MKKIIISIILSAFLITLCACSNNSTSEVSISDTNNLASYLGKDIEVFMGDHEDFSIDEESDTQTVYSINQTVYVYTNESNIIQEIALAGESQYDLNGITYGQNGEDARNTLTELVKSEEVTESSVLSVYSGELKDDSSITMMIMVDNDTATVTSAIADIRVR